MSIRATNPEVDDTPAIIINAGIVSLEDKRSYLVKNPTGGDTVYLGGDDLTNTPTNYFAVEAGGAVSVEIGPGDNLYATCTTGETSTLEIIGTRNII